MIGKSWYREDVAKGHIENLKVEHSAFFRARAFMPALLAVDRWRRKSFGNCAFRILDIGCGGGAYAIPFTNYITGSRYTGVDPSQAMIAQAKAYHRYKFPNENLRFAFYLGGFDEGLQMLNLSDQSLLFVCQSAEYTKNPMETMLDCIEALSPGRPFVFHKLRLDQSKKQLGKRIHESTYAGQSDEVWLWSLPMVIDLLFGSDLEFGVMRWPSDPYGCVTIGGCRNDL